MIDFFSETDFEISQRKELSHWLSSIITNENKEEGDIGFVFCNDDELHRINKEFLKHDTLTDIITFDYSLGNELHGEIYISIERVKENAQEFKCDFMDELHRVMSHGILHLSGYKDKTKEESEVMRAKEEECLSIRNFL